MSAELPALKVLVPALVGLQMGEAYKRAVISGVMLTPVVPKSALPVRGVIIIQHPAPGTATLVAGAVYVRASQTRG